MGLPVVVPGEDLGEGKVNYRRFLDEAISKQAHLDKVDVSAVGDELVPAGREQPVIRAIDPVFVVCGRAVML